MKPEPETETDPSNVEENSKGAPLPRMMRTVFVVVLVHVVFFGGLLMQGCKKTTKDESVSGEGDKDSLPEVRAEDPYYSEETAAKTLFPDIVKKPEESGGGFNPGAQNDPLESTELNPAQAVELAGPKTFPHTIVAGDTLYGIASQYGVTTRMLQDANPALDARRLRIGETVEVPSVVPGSEPVESPVGVVGGGGNFDGTLYTVQNGDSLWGIANKNNTTVDALKQVNDLRTGLIHPGKTLKIPPTVGNQK
jgi:LysM repeat protein